MSVDRTTPMADGVYIILMAVQAFPQANQPGLDAYMTFTFRTPPATTITTRGHSNEKVTGEVF